MRSSRIRLEAIAHPDNLREAFHRAAKGKSTRPEVIAFRERLHEELAELSRDIISGTVEVGRCAVFTIHDPKERKIHAPCFRERVLHHALVGPLEPYLESLHIHDTYACRRGKGREAAIRRAEAYAAKHPYFLKLDVAKYFDSIPQEPLLALLRPRLRDSRVFALWEKIIRAYETSPGRALPIGALTSQHLANLYLGRIDRLAKESLRIPGYVRYMDDMALWGERDELRNAWRVIERTLHEALGLTLKANAHLQHMALGMDFLGYRVFPDGSRLMRKSRLRFIRDVRSFESALASGEITEAEVQRRMMARLAFVRTAGRETVLHRLFAPNSGAPCRVVVRKGAPTA